MNNMDKQLFLSLICDVFCGYGHCGTCKLYSANNSCEGTLENLIKINPSYVLGSVHAKLPNFEHFSKELFDWAE